MSRLEVIRPRRPSLWDKIRSYTLGPLSLRDPEIRKYFQPSGETATGVAVNEHTAMNFSAVWSAVKLISGDVAGLPLVLYKTKGDGKERYTDHPLYRILHDSPNPEMSSFTLRQTLQAHVLTWGNGYAEIERDGVRRPRYLWPITPERVTPIRDAGGRLAYRVSNPGKGADSFFDPSDMIHIVGLGWDGTQGYSPIAKARESVALGLAAERFGGKFFGNGSTFGGVITHPTRFATPAARENFENALKKRSQGVDRAHKLLLMEEGMTYQQMGIPPDQAQFLESRQFQITEIARWFNVPPHKIGDLSRATFSNIEQQNIEYFQTTLIHWLETWEQELMRKLISPLERNQQHIEHVVEGLLRGDSAGRAALETAEFHIGGLTPNEARALANRDPVKGGDRAFVQVGMMPLDRLDEYIDAQIEGMKPKPAAAPQVGRSAEDEATITELRASVERLTGQLAEAREFSELAQRGAADAIAGHIAEATGRAEALARAIKADEKAEGLEQELGIARSLLKDAEDRLDIATKATDAMTAEREQAIALANALGEAKEAAENNVGRLIANRDAVALERDEAKAAQAHTAELLDGATTALAAEQAERAREMAEADRAREQAQKFEALYEEERAQLRKHVQEWNDWQGSQEAKAGELSATIAERDAALTEREQQATAATQAQQIAEAAKVQAEARAEQAEKDKAIAEAAQAAANALVEHRRQAEAARVAAVMTAHRGLMADAMRRVLAKETDRARRHQAKPEKLKAWMGTFYPDHVETIADVLRPVIAAQIAWRQSKDDPAKLAQEIAAAHCETSQEQLRMVLAVEDFSANFERLMQRWEANRPEAVADQFMQEGVSHVRSL